MRRALRRLIELAGGALARLAPLAYRSERERETARRQERERQWYADQGDQTLRLDYDLAPSAVVLDAGGYHGDWAADIYCKFSCRIHVFEPVSEFATTVTRRFEHNESVTVHRYGLGSEDRRESITLDEGGSSAVLTPIGIDPRTELIELRDVLGVVEGLGLQEIDLLKLNIEGGEYELLERLLSADAVGRFRYLQIQFHLGVPDAESRRRRIQEGLSHSHRQVWCYPWVWESWERSA